MNFEKSVSSFVRSVSYNSYISSSLKKIFSNKRKAYTKAKTEYRKAVRRNIDVQKKLRVVNKKRDDLLNVMTMLRRLIDNRNSNDYKFGNKSLKNLKVFFANHQPIPIRAPRQPVEPVEPVVEEEEEEEDDGFDDIANHDVFNDVTINPVGIYNHVYVVPEDYLPILRAIRQGTHNIIPRNTIEVKVTLLVDDDDNKTYNVHYETYSIDMFTKKYNINQDFVEFLYNSSETMAYHADVLGYKNIRYAYNYYSQIQRVNRRGIRQVYRDGLTNCLLTPIKDFFTNKRDSSKTNITRKTYQTRINNIDAFMLKYIDGVPEDKIQEICDKLFISIEILDIFNKVTLSFEGKNSRKIFKLVNTKINHVDIYQDIEDIEVVKQKSYMEMNTLVDELKEKNEQFIYYKNSFGVNKIVSNQIIYEIEDSYKEVASQFSKDIDIFKICGIDHIKERKLSNYLASGCHISGCVDYVNNISDYRKSPLKETMSDLDHEKSYTQFKTCKYYKGFMPKPSDVFRKIDIPKEQYKEFLNTVIGIFTIKNIDNSKCTRNVRKHISKLGIYGNKGNRLIINDNDTETLPCAELLFMLDLGLTFEIIFGCFSHINNKFDFEFTDVMKTSKIKTFTIENDKYKEETGASFYAMWCGCLGHKSEYKTVNCHMSDSQLMTIVCNNYEEDEIKQITDKEAELRIKKLRSTYCPQVLAFITSYARMNVLSQLFEFNSENVVRVNADAFFFKGTIPKLHDKFRNKDDGIIKMNEGGSRYYNDTHHLFTLDDQPNTEMMEDNYIMTNQLHALPKHNNNNSYTYKHQILLKIGCGGGGKTFSSLMQNYNNVCYVAPSHKLLVAKAQEFKDLKLCTLAKLTGSKLVSEEELKELNKNKKDKNKENKKEGCLMLFNKYSPATIICDEITQYTDFQKKIIMETYKHSKIIFCGDISADGKIMYQLPCMIGKRFTTEGIECVEEYNISKRCKCDKLGYMLKTLRNAIKDGYSGQEMILSIVKQNKFNIVKPSEMKYDINDYILCSKRNCNVHGKSDCNCDGKNYTYEWTNKYDGKFENNKYLMIKNIDGHCNGDVIISSERPKGAIPRHAFTCHQIQGETIKNSKIFIDSRNLFDIAMLYTAVSRAEYFDQIYIIYGK